MHSPNQQPVFPPEGDILLSAASITMSGLTGFLAEQAATATPNLPPQNIAVAGALGLFTLYFVGVGGAFAYRAFKDRAYLGKMWGEKQTGSPEPQQESESTFG